LANTSWMFVTEVNGEVEGFVSAFRTNKSAEEFKSWEDSTANGTLEGKVDPNGRYVYVTNMTLTPEATNRGGMNMALGHLFGAIIAEGGVEYGYFESRMPQFRYWLRKNKALTEDPERLQELANEYVKLRTSDGKLYDKLLRTFEDEGFVLGNPVPNAFNDSKSMNFGVVGKQPIPLNGRFFEIASPLRRVIGGTLTLASKNPTLAKKII